MLDKGYIVRVTFERMLDNYEDVILRIEAAEAALDEEPHNEEMLSILHENNDLRMQMRALLVSAVLGNLLPDLTDGETLQ